MKFLLPKHLRDLLFKKADNGEDEPRTFSADLAFNRIVQPTFEDSSVTEELEEQALVQLPQTDQQQLENSRAFSDTELYLSEKEQLELDSTLRDLAMQQGRTEKAVYSEIIQTGVSQLVSRKYFEYKKKWESLSTREKQVAVLISFDHRSYEIAKILGLSYDTIRTHSKNVYKKFVLSNKDTHQARNELRHILSELNNDFDLKEWWEYNHP